MKTIPSLSIDTKLLGDRLSALSVGSILTYEDLSGSIGRNVRLEARSNLTSAIHRLLRDGYVFATVRGVGIKRLSDQEIIGVGLDVVQKVRRAAGRAQTKLAAVQDFDSLPRDSKTQHQVAMSVLGVLRHMTKSTTVKKLESRVAAVQSELPLTLTLEALK